MGTAFECDSLDRDNTYLAEHVLVFIYFVFPAPLFLTAWMELESIKPGSDGKIPYDLTFK